ncbi:MAG TPA: hypothetical protein VJU58_13605 [Microbacterium sp.]|nr:hypothetical protein [Microbacterium sp.]
MTVTASASGAGRTDASSYGRTAMKNRIAHPAASRQSVVDLALCARAGPRHPSPFSTLQPSATQRAVAPRNVVAG